MDGKANVINIRPWHPKAPPLPGDQHQEFKAKQNVRSTIKGKGTQEAEGYKGKTGGSSGEVRLGQGPERRAKLLSGDKQGTNNRGSRLVLSAAAAQNLNFGGLSACEVSKRNCHRPGIKSQPLRHLCGSVAWASNS